MTACRLLLLPLLLAAVARATFIDCNPLFPACPAQSCDDDSDQAVCCGKAPNSNCFSACCGSTTVQPVTTSEPTPASSTTSATTTTTAPVSQVKLSTAGGHTLLLHTAVEGDVDVTDETGHFGLKAFRSDTLETLDDHSTTLSQHGNTLTAHGNAITGNTNHITDVENSFNAFDTEASGRLDALENRADLSEDDFAALEQRLFEDIHVEIARNFSLLHNNLTVANDTLDVLAAAIAAAETDMQDVKDTALRAYFHYGKQAQSPALSCWDARQRRQAEGLPATSGMYWLDPDGAPHDDAVQIQCDMSTADTLLPLDNRIARGNYYTGAGSADDRRAFSRLTNGFYLTYGGMTMSQLVALGRMSASAEQTINFECRGVIAWRSTNNVPSIGNALEFMGPANVHERAWAIYSRLNPDVPAATDACKANDGTWRRTIFNFATANSDNQYLPIVDLTVQDHGGSGEQMGLLSNGVTFKGMRGDGLTQATAAETCSHLLVEQPHTGNGIYWIHANSADRYQLFCDMENGGFTELEGQDVPTFNRYTGPDVRLWLSAMPGESTLRYFDKANRTISVAFMQGLQSASSHANQKILLDTRGGVISWRHFSRENDFGMISPVESAIFRTYGGGVWNSKHPSTDFVAPATPDTPVTEPIVFNDTAWDNSGTRTTYFLFNHRDARMLPISDINLRDIGSGGEYFGMIVGEARFRTELGQPLSSLGSSRKRAARACSDIWAETGGMAPSGRYWINLGQAGRHGAFSALCDMTDGWTGVAPQRQVPAKNWRTGADGYRRFSQESGGFVFTYDQPRAIINTIQQMATRGRQSINFLCRGVEAWYAGTSRLSGSALRWMGMSQTGLYTQYSTNPNQRRPSVKPELDGCRHNLEGPGNHWYSAPFEWDSGYIGRRRSSSVYESVVPVEDVYVHDHGGSGEQMGMEIGPAFFML